MTTFRYYGMYLLVIAGLGGLLYGVDVGIISAALLFIGKTIPLTPAKTSVIVSAVLGGSMLSSLVTGFLCDWCGRKKMMVFSGVLFLLSVVVIASSKTFYILLLGRLLQGISGGVIAVAVPLFLAESLGAATRGRGSAVFQFMLTFGILLAAGIGWHYTRVANRAITMAQGNQAKIQAAENGAWRGMFVTVAYPGAAFLMGCLFLSETPRWLLKKGRPADATRSLQRALPPDQAQRELFAMQNAPLATGDLTSPQQTILQRRYVLPFLLACSVLICNQTTGINSVLAYLSVILRQAGLDDTRAVQGDFLVKLLNCIMTGISIALIDTKGRRFLLILGTTGMTVALATSAFVFHYTTAVGSTALTGLYMSICMGLFIASFAAGPGVVVWLTLSELMPTRIRSAGMGIALLLNQGAGTLIAGSFLPIVGRFGYAALFSGLAFCTLVYFAISAFLLPETKGRTLEEIERHFLHQTVDMSST